MAIPYPWNHFISLKLSGSTKGIYLNNLVIGLQHVLIVWLPFKYKCFQWDHCYLRTQCLPDSQVSLDTKLHEPLEWCCLHGTTHYIDHFISQLEMGLPAKVPSWGTLKHKTKIWNTANFTQINAQKSIPYHSCKTLTTIQLCAIYNFSHCLQ